MNRLTIIAVVGVLTTFATSTAQAQYMWGRGYTFNGGPRPFYPIPPNYFGGLPPVMPTQPLPGVNQFNPLMFSPFNRPYSPQNQAATTYYYLNRYSSSNNAAPNSNSTYGATSGYMTGGSVNPSLYWAQQDFSRAQGGTGNYSPSSNARAAIAGQGAYEQRVKQPTSTAKPTPDNALAEAIAATDNLKLVSGEYLNRLASAILAAESRGAKGSSTQLGPPLLSRITFAGSPEAEALNVFRRVGRLDFPAAFESVEPLRALRPTLEKDLVTVAAIVKAGKPVDSFAVGTFAADVKKAQDALTATINTLPFEDAVAAKRFLNQLEATAQALKDSKSAGLFNPQWETTGASTAELVRHMAKFKLQFGPASAADEEAYATIHQALAGYLRALETNGQPKK